MTQEIVENTSTEALNPTRERLNNLIRNILRAIAMDTPPKPFEEHGLDSVASEEDITEYQLQYLEILRKCAQAALYLALTGELEESIKPEHPVLDSIRELAEFLHANPDELKGFIDPKSIAEHETNQRFALLQEAVQKAVLEAVANTPESSAVKVMEYLLSSDPYNPESSTPTSKWFDEFLYQHPELEELDPLYYAAILTSASRYQDAIDHIKNSLNLTEYQKQIIVREILEIQLSDPNIRIEDVFTQIRGLKDLTPKDQDFKIAEILVNRASNDPRITIEEVSERIRGLERLTPRDQDWEIANIFVNRASNDPSIRIEKVSERIRGLGGLTPRDQDWEIANIFVNRASNDPSIRIEKVSERIRKLKYLGSWERDWHIAEILVNRASNNPNITIEEVSKRIRGLKDLSSWERDKRIDRILGYRASRDINTKITDLEPNTKIPFISKVIKLYSDPTTLQRLLLEYIDSSGGSVSQ